MSDETEISVSLVRELLAQIDYGLVNNDITYARMALGDLKTIFFTTTKIVQDSPNTQ